MSDKFIVPLAVPIYSQNHIPTFRDHLTRGLLSGIFVGRSFVVLGKNGQDDYGKYQETKLSWIVTLSKIVAIATLIPIAIALYLNYQDQSNRTFTLTPKETPKTNVTKSSVSVAPKGGVAEIEDPEADPLAEHPEVRAKRDKKVELEGVWGKKANNISALCLEWNRFVGSLKMVYLTMIEDPSNESMFTFPARKKLFDKAGITFNQIPVLYEKVLERLPYLAKPMVKEFLAEDLMAIMAGKPLLSGWNRFILVLEKMHTLKIDSPDDTSLYLNYKNDLFDPAEIRFDDVPRLYQQARSKFDQLRDRQEVTSLDLRDLMA